MAAASEPSVDPSAALLARWQDAGDREALDGLLRIEIELLKHRLRAQQGGRLSPSLSASDVAQEAVLNLVKVRATPSFEVPAALRAYLWKSALRLLAGHFERAGSNLEHLDERVSRGASAALATSGGLGAVEDDERTLAIELTLHLLEPDERQILALVYFDELSLEDAATRLTISHEAAKKRLQRARTRLAAKLGAWSELVA
ncbi:MAG: sigma-70 family RNA polymerase sigma factor [Planctomycetes bacterium]|nr:sigma-70 family RNA polymerase sigma factor [Planctomycetota bacterium]